LLVWLAAEISARFSAGIRTGKQLVGSSAGGTSASYQIAGTYGLSPQDVFKFWDEALDLYDESSAALTASGVSSPNQSQIVTEMRFRLAPRESVVADFSEAIVSIGEVAPT
jgi:hypothetical protein